MPLPTGFEGITGSETTGMRKMLPWPDRPRSRREGGSTARGRLAVLDQVVGFFHRHPIAEDGEAVSPCLLPVTPNDGAVHGIAEDDGEDGSELAVGCERGRGVRRRGWRVPLFRRGR